MRRREPAWPNYLGWAAALIVLIVLGPIGYAVAMLSSQPSGTGADPAAKTLVALLVLGAAALTGFAARGMGLLVWWLMRGRSGS